MTAVPPSEPTSPAALAGRALGMCRRAMQSLPPRARWAVLGGAAILVVLACYLALSVGSAKLKLVGRHGFRSAEVSVWVDGKLAYSDQVSGNAKKRLGIFGRAGGTFSRTLGLAAGEHVVQVRLASPTEHYDQTRRCGVNLIPGKEATLLISGERGGLSLAYHGPPVMPAELPGHDYAAVVRSLLVTVGGSVTSAVIGFLVQDFLRTRKARQTEAVNQSSTPAS